MLANLKLRNRILLGYSIPIALFIGLAIPVFSSVAKVQEASRQTKISLTAVEVGTQMAVAITKMARDERGYIATKDESFLNDYRSDLQSFREKSDLVGNTIENPEQKERLSKMIALSSQYDDFSNQINTLLKENKTVEAINMLKSGKGVAIIKEFENLNADFNKKEHTILDGAIAKAESNLNFLQVAVEVGTLLGIVAAILAAYKITSGIAQKITQAVGAIASSSNQIAATVEQQERTATHQATSVNETTTTMDELGASSRQSAEQAEAAAMAARKALSLADEGTQAVGQTLEGMSELRERVAAIAHEIIRLSEQTGQIGSISNVVTDLANQTNMLALNAAVEAVRAGDHGKGFGVVAAEIRKLADQSKKSAEKINNLVADIQQAINSTVMVTDEGTRTVKEGMQIAQKTADTFTGVAEAVNNVVVNNQQISLNIKQQATAIQQVVTAMNTLNQGAQESATGVSQTKLGTQRLNEAAQDLKAVV